MGYPFQGIINRKSPHFPIILIVCLSLGCSSKNGMNEPGEKAAFKGQYPIRAVATVGMIGDAITRVGKGLVSVECLMAPGVDPHLYKASQKDVDRLDKADIVFYGGLHLEGKMTDILEKIGRIKPSIPVGEQLPAESLIRSEMKQGEITTDPHVWFDASLWAIVVEKIGEALAGFDPSHASAYQGEAQAYRKEILELHEWAKTRIAEIPQSQRLLVTAHDAFHYFGRAYGIEVRGLQGMSTASEFGLNDVNQLVDTIVERKIKAMFIETSIPRRSIEAVQQGCLARGQQVVIGGELFSDSMGDPSTPEGTYLGMFRHNINTIVDSLK